MDSIVTSQSNVNKMRAILTFKYYQNHKQNQTHPNNIVKNSVSKKSVSINQSVNQLKVCYFFKTGF